MKLVQSSESFLIIIILHKIAWQALLWTAFPAGGVCTASKKLLSSKLAGCSTLIHRLWYNSLCTFLRFSSGNPLIQGQSETSGCNRASSLSRLFVFSVFCLGVGALNLHPPPTLFGVSQDPPKGSYGANSPAPPSSNSQATIGNYTTSSAFSAAASAFLGRLTILVTASSSFSVAMQSSSLIWQRMLRKNLALEAPT